MLPGGTAMGRVNSRTATPIASILVVAVVGIGINMLSAGIAANVVSICSVSYYFIYALTVGGAIYAYAKKRMPSHRTGDFSLGRWFMPVAVAAFVFASTVIVIALAPQEGHVAAKYVLGAQLIGLVWYLAYLRPRIADRRVGVYRDEVVKLEAEADAVVA
jgi:amino acid transporter